MSTKENCKEDKTRMIKNSPLLLLILLIIFSITIIGCQEHNQLIDNNNSIYNIKNDNVRPLINRTHNNYNPNNYKNNVYKNNKQIDENKNIKNQNIINNNNSGYLTKYNTNDHYNSGIYGSKNKLFYKISNISIGENQYLLPIGFSFGKIYKLIDEYDYKLLKSSPMMIEDGNFRGYDQKLIFDINNSNSGNISFISEDNYLGTALVFKKNRPIFAYELDSEVPFWSDRVINSKIKILGSDYQIMEANNFSLMLNGINIERYLNIQNNKPLITNKKRLTDSNVWYDGLGFGFTVYANDWNDDDQGDSGLIIHEGKSMRDVFSENKVDDLLVSPFFNIKYDGLESIPEHATIRIINHDGKYVYIICETPTNSFRIPLLGYNKSGSLWYGDEDNKILFGGKKEINKDDKIIISTTNPDGEFTSKLLKFTDIDNKEKNIFFRDEARNKISTDYRNGYAYLPLFDREYKIKVIDNNTIRFENNYNSREKSFYITNIMRLSFEDVKDLKEISNINGYVFNITIETAPFSTQKRDNFGRLNQEEIKFGLKAENGTIRTIIYDPLVVEPIKEEDSATITDWGSEIHLNMDSDDPQTTSKEVDIVVPIRQRFGIIELGAIK